MLYNKREVRKVNDKKVLHKVKKQWVVLSAFALALLGAGVIATTNVQADPVSASNEQPKTSNVVPNDEKPSTQSTKPNTQSIMKQAKQMTSTLMANAGQKANHAQSANANQTKPSAASSGNKNTSSVASSKNAASSTSNSAKQVVSNLASGFKRNATNGPSSAANSGKTSQSNEATNGKSASNGNAMTTVQAKPGLLKDVEPKMNLTDSSQSGEYAGLNYRYDPSTKTVEFFGGTLLPQESSSDTTGGMKTESDFVKNANSDIKNAYILKFDNNIDMSKVSDINSMLSSDKNVKHIDINLNTSDLNTMSNLFSSDSNLESISFGSDFDTSNVLSSSDGELGMFRNDTELKQFNIESNNVEFISMPSSDSANAPKMYQQLNKKDNNGNNYTNGDPTDFSQGTGIGTFVTSRNPDTPQNTDTLQYTEVTPSDNSSSAVPLPASKSLEGDAGSSHTLQPSDIPNGFILAPNQSNSFTFNNASHEVKIIPQHDGLNYDYDKLANAITFQDGTLDSSILPSDFLNKSSNLIKNANIITFDSDVNFNNISDMASMFANDPNLKEINFEQNTSNVTNMSDMFANDSNLRNVSFGYKFSTKSSSDASDMTGMFKNDNIKQINIMSPNIKLYSSAELSNPNMYNTFSTGTDAQNPTNLEDGQNHQGVFTNQITNNIIVPYPLLPKNFPNLTQDPSAFTEARFVNVPDILYNTPQDPVHKNDAVIKIFYTKYDDKNNNSAINWSDIPSKYQPISLDNPTGITNIPSQNYKIIGIYKNYTGEGNHGLSNNDGINGYQLAINSGKEHPFGSKRLHRFTPEDINGYIFRPQAKQESTYNPYNTQNNDDYAQNGLASTSLTNPDKNSANGGDMYVTDEEKDSKGHIISQNQDHDTLSIVLSYMPYSDSITYQYGNHTQQVFHSDSKQPNNSPITDKNSVKDYDADLANLVKSSDLWTKDIPVNNDFPYGLYVTQSDKAKFYDKLNQGLLNKQKYQYGRNNLIIPLHKSASITVKYVDNGNVISVPYYQSDKQGTPFTFDITGNIPKGYSFSTINPNFKKPSQFTTTNQVVNVPITRQYTDVINYVYNNKTIASTKIQTTSDQDNKNNQQQHFINDVRNANNTDLYNTFNAPRNYNISQMSISDRQQAVKYIHNLGTDTITIPVQPSQIDIDYVDKSNYQILESKSAFNTIGSSFDINPYLSNLPTGYEYAGINNDSSSDASVDGKTNVNKNNDNEFDGTHFKRLTHTIYILLIKRPTAKVNRSTITVNYLDKSNHDKFISKAGSDTENDGTDFDIVKYLSNLPKGYEYAGIKTPTSDDNFDGTFFDNQNHTIDVLLTKAPTPKIAKSTITVNYLDKATGQRVSPSKSDTENVSTDFDIGNYLNPLPSDYEYAGIKNANGNDNFNGTEFDYNNHTIDVLLTKVPTPKVAKSTITVNYLDKATNQKVSSSKSDTEKVSTPFDIGQYLSNLPSDYQYAGVKNANGNDNFNGTEFDYNNHTIDVLLTKLPQGTINVNYVDKSNHRILAQAKPVTNQVGQSFDIGDYLNDLPSGYEYAGMNGNTNYFERGNQTVNILLSKVPTPKVAQSTITINYLDKATGQKVSPSKSNTENVSTNFDIKSYLNNLPQGYKYSGVKNNVDHFDYDNHTVDVLLSKVTSPSSSSNNPSGTAGLPPFTPMNPIVPTGSSASSAQSSTSSSTSGTSAAKSGQNASRAASSTTPKRRAKAANRKPTRAKINHDIKDHHVTPSDSTHMTKKQMNRVKKNDRKEYSKIVQVRKQAKDCRVAKVNKDIKSGKLTSSDVKQMTPKQWRRTKRTSPRTYRKAVRIQTKSNVKSARKQLREFKKASPKSYRRVVKSSTKLARQVNNLKPSRMSRDVIQRIASTATPQQLNYLAIHNPKVYQKIMAEQDLLGISHVVSSHRSIARMARTMTPRQLAYLAAHNPKLYRKVLAEQDLLGIAHVANSRADANAYVNGIDDARLGLLAKSHNAQYLKGYNAFKKANGGKLPQTGEANGHLSLAAAVLMVLSLTFSLPVLKRKRHDE